MPLNGRKTYTYVYLLYFFCKTPKNDPLSSHIFWLQSSKRNRQAKICIASTQSSTLNSLGQRNSFLPHNCNFSASPLLCCSLRRPKIPVFHIVIPVYLHVLLLQHRISFFHVRWYASQTFCLCTAAQCDIVITSLSLTKRNLNKPCKTSWCFSATYFIQTWVPDGIDSLLLSNSHLIVPFLVPKNRKNKRGRI